MGVLDHAGDIGPLQVMDPGTQFLFTETSTPYVARIPSAYVEGEWGLVYQVPVIQGAGQCGTSYAGEPGFTFQDESPVPESTAADRAACERYPELASLIQRYGWQYWHFVAETLPRAALLVPLLGPDTKVLVWGSPWEAGFFARLGISADRLVTYEPSKVYCAGTLLFPTPTPRITPPREALALTRTALGAEPPLPAEERDLIVWCSRADQEVRRVMNERPILSALKAAFPNETIITFESSEGLSVSQTVNIFRRAKLVLGPHGAGLSHIIFSGPGASVIEFSFLRAPPMMFCKWPVAREGSASCCSV